MEGGFRIGGAYSTSTQLDASNRKVNIASQLGTYRGRRIVLENMEMEAGGVLNYWLWHAIIMDDMILIFFS